MPAIRHIVIPAIRKYFIVRIRHPSSHYESLRRRPMRRSTHSFRRKPRRSYSTVCRAVSTESVI
jgi:hypothetical protein